MKNEKNCFTIKRLRKRSSHGFGAWFSNTRWICYEEPLQPSCLGKNCKKMVKLIWGTENIWYVAVCLNSKTPRTYGIEAFRSMIVSKKRGFPYGIKHFCIKTLEFFRKNTFLLFKCYEFLRFWRRDVRNCRNSKIFHCSYHHL